MKEARKRLAFDELFLYTMALNYIRENGKEIIKTLDSLFTQDDARKILGITDRW